jgi:hypothetical protein
MAPADRAVRIRATALPGAEIMVVRAHAGSPVRLQVARSADRRGLTLGSGLAPPRLVAPYPRRHNSKRRRKACATECVGRPELPPADWRGD